MKSIFDTLLVSPYMRCVINTRLKLTFEQAAYHIPILSQLNESQLNELEFLFDLVCKKRWITSLDSNEMQAQI